MDLLRSCYKTKMRFFRDTEDLTNVEWYFVPDDSPLIGVVTPFCSTNWCQEPGPPDGIGEVPFDRAYSNGNGNPGGQSGRRCGSPEVWLRGLSLPPPVPVVLDSAGRLACCLPRMPEVLPTAALRLLLNSGELTQPAMSSVGLWPNLAADHQPAVQDDAAMRPSIGAVAPELPKAVQFQGDQNMTFRVNPAFPTWQLWTVLYAETSQPSMVKLAANGYYLELEFNSDPASDTRSIAVVYSVGGTIAKITVPGFQLLEPMIVSISYDGTTLTFKSYRGIVGQDIVTVSLPNISISNLGGFPALIRSGSVYVASIIWYARKLSDTEGLAVIKYINSLYPETGDEQVITGTIIDWPSAVTPSGFLRCDGSAYTSAAQPALFTVLGTAWNTFRGQAAPAAGSFRVPLLNGLATIGAGIAVATGGSALTSARVLKDILGEETHTLSAGELALHGHAITDPGHQHAGDGGGSFVMNDAGSEYLSLGADRGTVHADTANATTGISINGTGGDAPHNNVQPVVAMYKLIKT